MEHENLKKIKFSRAYTPLFLMLSLFLLGLSIYCVFYPVGLKLEKPVALTFYIAGGIGALYFAFSSFNYIFQLISPKNAIILSPEGFADFSFCGTGAGFIEWSNIKTVKIATTKHGKLFGLTLVNPDLVLTDTSKTVAKAIKRNIDAKLPEIIIRQDDLSINLNELLELFDDYRHASQNLETKIITNANNEKTRIIRVQDNLILEPTNDDDYNYDNSKNITSIINLPDETTKDTKIEDDKSLDELLSDLAASLRQNQEKLDILGKKNVSSEIESIISQLKNDDKKNVDVSEKNDDTDD